MTRTLRPDAAFLPRAAAYRTAAAALVLYTCVLTACNSGSVDNTNLSTPVPSTPTPVLMPLTPDGPPPPTPTPVDERATAFAKMRELGTSINTLSADVAITATLAGARPTKLSASIYFKRVAPGRDKYFVSLRGRGQGQGQTPGQGQAPVWAVSIAAEGDKVDVLVDKNVHLLCRQEAADFIGLPLALLEFRQFLEHYSAEYSETSAAGRPTALFKLTARRKEPVEVIQAWVDKQTWRLREFFFIYRHEQTRPKVTVSFSNLNINPRLPNARFRLDYPADTYVNRSACRGQE
jgi:hypothetical protein